MDNQPSVEIHILQGERKMARDNRTVGRFILDGIPPAPRGVPQIEVTFDMDANGILSVTAKDKGTGKEQHVRIEGSTGLSEEEIAKMKADAEANAEADKIAAEKATKINAADGLIFQTEKQLKEYGDKIPADKKADIETALEELRKAHASQEIAQIDPAVEKLNNVWQAASQDIYNAQQAADGAQTADAGAQDGTGGDDAVEDVEFEEVES